MKTPITGLDPAQIASLLELKPYQGRQIFQWMHQRQVFDFNQMTDLSKPLRALLCERCSAPQLSLCQLATSQNSPGTRKALFTLLDGETIESVLIRDRERATVCVSTQVGCPVRCSFCATGQSGYVRDLNAGEIVEQVLHLVAQAHLTDRKPNIVYMGMGEPLRNYDATVHSIRLLMAKEGLNAGARRITVSTAGDADGIRRFAREDWQVRLSLSLHAANDGLRRQLVPLARQHTLPDLMAAIRQYAEATGRQVTIEWVLLDGVNDSKDDAQQLAALVRGLPASVNLIFYNPVEGLPYRASEPAKARAFERLLAEKGITVTLRQERGGDIDAACGQLRRRTPRVTQ